MASDSHNYIFTCVHCNDPFIIYERDFNCKILRHGVMKATMQPMNPHASKEESESLVRERLIYGCGKPMRIVKNKDISGYYIVENCEYI